MTKEQCFAETSTDLIEAVLRDGVARRFDEGAEEALSAILEEGIDVVLARRCPGMTQEKIERIFFRGQFREIRDRLAGRIPE